MLHHLRPLLIPALLITVLAIFWPGLGGPFLLDDHLHLPQLAGQDGDVDTPIEIIELASSGGSPTGRPLAFLSLLINDNAWPANARDFKYTNLLVHALNTMLVFLLMSKLAQICRLSRNQAVWVSAFVTTIWALHPFHLSPTMMVIQRMTLLAGTFTLAALLCYLKGRYDHHHRPLIAYTWMAGGVGICMVIAVLFKETGSMIASYLLALELTLLARTPKPRFHKTWAFLFIALPLLGLLAYSIFSVAQMHELYLKRDFTPWERLATEARVIVDYARGILLPNLSNSGPFRDDYTISRGLMHPPTTMLACVFVASIFGTAIAKRKAWPILSFGALWFLGGHLLESTALPLELYFEHRNYLPMLGLQFAATILIINAAKNHEAIRPYAALTAITYIALTAWITHESSKVWGNKNAIAVIWAAERPGSFRAQFGAIDHDLRTGNIMRAATRYDTLRTLRPRDVGVLLLAYSANHCSDSADPLFPVDVRDITELLPNAKYSHSAITSLINLQRDSQSGKCTSRGEDIRRFAELLLQNPIYANIAKANTTLNLIIANQYIAERNLNQAMNALERAYQSEQLYSTAISQVLLLITAGLYEDAAHYIQRAKESKLSSPLLVPWKNQQIKNLEDALIQASTKPIQKQPVE